MRYSAGFSALAVFALVSCGSSEDPLVARTQKQLQDEMLDGQSAQFRNVKVLRPGVVCGEVNGKNQLGGYTGFYPFVGKLKGDGIQIDVVQGQLPQFPTTDYPLEELAECFPDLKPAIEAILGEPLP